MADAERQALDTWIERQFALSAAGLLRSISTTVVKKRPGFGQVIHAAPGSIVASPVPAAWDPDPDYFFHWFRDAAVVIDALLIAHQAGAIGPEAIGHFGDFIRFSLSLNGLDGTVLAADTSWREGVAGDFRQYLRPNSELVQLHPERVRMETRVNPDGTLDITRWSRPQNDGAATTALALLRWVRSGVELPSELLPLLGQLLREELAQTLRHCRETCFDIWEEEEAHHYYTARVQGAALEQGAAWLGEGPEAESCRAAGGEITKRLDGFWLEREGFLRSRIAPTGLRSSKDLDIAVILAANHARCVGERHGMLDERLAATLDKLADYFAQEFPINRPVPAGRAPALGRYPGDAYFGGNPWYIATLAGAEFEYRRTATLAAAGEADEAALAEQRGDAYLETVRAFTPPSGEMSEQFDKRNGAPLSAKDLAWSYAAFISAVAARRATPSAR